MADKKNLSERDICSKYITPAIVDAGWDLHSQIQEEVSFTKGRIIVRGKPVLAVRFHRLQSNQSVDKLYEFDETVDKFQVDGVTTRRYPVDRRGSV